MANIIQKIFLSPRKQFELNCKHEIMRLIAANPIAHHTYTTKSGMTVQRLSIKTPDCNLYTECFCDTKKPENARPQYTLRVDAPKDISMATHSDIDKFAEKTYIKMYNIWKSKEQKAK